MEDFFNFRAMWTLTIIKIVFVLGVVMIGVAGIVSLVSVVSEGPRGLLGFLGAVMLLFFWRLVCESLIIIFKMHESLEQLVALASKERELA